MLVFLLAPWALPRGDGTTTVLRDALLTPGQGEDLLTESVRRGSHRGQGGRPPDRRGPVRRGVPAADRSTSSRSWSGCWPPASSPPARRPRRWPRTRPRPTGERDAFHHHPHGGRAGPARRPARRPVVDARSPPQAPFPAGRTAAPRGRPLGPAPAPSLGGLHPPGQPGARAAELRDGAVPRCPSPRRTRAPAAVQDHRNRWRIPWTASPDAPFTAYRPPPLAVAVALGAAPPSATAAGRAAGTGPGAARVPLRVATYNIHAGAGQDNVFDLDRTAAAIRDLDADVIGLQEVDVHWGARSDFADEARSWPGGCACGCTSHRSTICPGHGGRAATAVRGRRAEPPSAARRAEPRDHPAVHADTRSGAGPRAGLRRGDGQGRRHPSCTCTRPTWTTVRTPRSGGPRSTTCWRSWPRTRARKVLLGDFNAEPGAPQLSRLWGSLADAAPERREDLPGGRPGQADRPGGRLPGRHRHRRPRVGDRGLRPPSGGRRPPAAPPRPLTPSDGNTLYVLLTIQDSRGTLPDARPSAPLFVPPPCPGPTGPGTAEGDLRETPSHRRGHSVGRRGPVHRRPRPGRSRRRRAVGAVPPPRPRPTPPRRPHSTRPRAFWTAERMRSATPSICC